VVPAPGPDKDDTKPSLAGAELGIHLLVCLCLGGVLGYGLDSWLASKPWGTLAGFALGFAAWLRSMWKVFKKL
jgi:F0F1-type ATP synthase assembly protein I